MTTTVRIYEHDKKKLEQLCRQLEEKFGGKFRLQDGLEFMFSGDKKTAKDETKIKLRRCKGCGSRFLSKKKGELCSCMDSYK